MAYKFQVGDSRLGGALYQEGAISGSSTEHIVGAATYGATIAATGSVTAGTSFIIGSADLNETDMEKLDGITNGTVAANKAVVADGSRDVVNVNQLGIASMANNWTNASRTVADMGIVTTMDLNGGTIDGVNIGAASAGTGKFSTCDATTDFTVGGTVITNNQLADDGDFTMDIAGDLILSADGGNVTMHDGTSTIFDFNVDDTTLTIHDDQDTGDKVVMTMAQHGAFTIETTDDDAAAANIQITADGTAELAGTTVTLDSAGDIVLSADGDNITMDDGTTTIFDFDVADPAFKIMDDAQVANYCSIAVGANGATTITTVDADAAAANLIITADGTVDIDSAGALTLDSGAAINLEPAAGSAVLIDGTVSIDGGAVTGVTTLAASSNITTTAGMISGSLALKGLQLTIGDSTIVSKLKAIQNVTTINASSTITGGTLTDGTFSANAGGLTGVASLAATANIDIGSHSFTAQTLISDVATGTPPLTVSSATNVPNLNASSLDGATFAAPGTIGGTTPGAATFAALTATSGDFSDGNIVNVGDLNCDSVSVDDAAQGLTIDFSGGNTTKNEMVLKDNVGNALAIVESTNVYMQFDTTDGAEVIKYEKALRMEDDVKLEFGTGADASIEYDENGTDELRFAGAAVTFEQAVTFDGAVTLGNATGDDLTNVGRWVGDFVPKTDSAIDLGTSALQFAEAHIDHGYIDAITATGTSTLTTVDINGGAIDGTIIGANSVAAGSFSTVGATGKVSLTGQSKGTVQLDVSGDVRVTGNMIVSGSKIIHSTSHLLVGDPVIGLGYSAVGTGSAGDRGIVMGLSGENATSMFWDENESQFAFCSTTSIPTDTAIVVAAYSDLRVKDLTCNSVAGSVLQDINLIGDEAGTLAAGFNAASADLTAARAWTLPASPTVGQIVYVKAAENCSDTLTVTITRAGAQTIDGATTAVLQSPNAAVGLCFIAANTWAIF